jgi:hypothetical protein
MGASRGEDDLNGCDFSVGGDCGWLNRGDAIAIAKIRQ